MPNPSRSRAELRRARVPEFPEPGLAKYDASAGRGGVFLIGVTSLFSMEWSCRSSSRIFSLSPLDWLVVGLGLRLAAGGPRILAPADKITTSSADDGDSTSVGSRGSYRVFSELGAVMPTSGDGALGVTGEGSHGVRAGE